MVLPWQILAIILMQTWLVLPTRYMNVQESSITLWSSLLGNFQYLAHACSNRKVGMTVGFVCLQPLNEC